MRQTGRILAAVIALAGAWLLAPGLPGSATSGEDDKGVLASLISRLLSSPGMDISVGAVDGALTSDATIRDLVISDARGPWLRLDRARLAWSRMALLTGRLSVDRLEIGRLELLRKPAPSGEPAVKSDEPLLPELPVKVEIATFSLADLALGEEWVGAAAHLAASGHAKLGNPSEGLDLQVDLRRTDASGALGLKLSFVPKTADLKLGLSAHEPPGGLLARAASLEGLPPVDLDLAGEGKLDAFAAKLDFKAGPNIGASGGAQLKRRGSERVLTLDASARVEGLLPEAIGPLFSGDTRLTGGLRFGDDASLRADNLALVASSARVDASGGIGGDKSLDGRVSLRSTDAAAGVHTSRIDIGGLTFEANASGTTLAPKLSARLLLDAARTPAGRFGHVDATLGVTTDGVLSDSRARLDVALAARGEKLSFANEGLASAVGDSFALEFRGRASPAGEADISIARLTLATAEANYTGKAGPGALAGRLFLAAPNLARFAKFAGVDLGGALTATADLSGSPAEQRVDASVTIAARRISTGIAALDPLLGGKLDVTGVLGSRPGGAFAFSGLTATGRRVTARLDGEATPAAADVNLTVAVPDMAAAFPKFAGKGEIAARLTGSARRPDLAAALVLTDASAMGRPIPRLRLDIAARDLLGPVAAEANLAGQVGGRAATGRVTLGKTAGGGWRVETSDLAVGAARLVAALAIDPANRASGRVTLKAPDLDELSPLALRKLAGRLDAEILLDASAGRQGVRVNAHAAGVRVGEERLDKLDIDASVADLFGVPAVEGIATIDRAVAGGETITRVRAVAKATPGGSDLTLAAEARGVALDARGRLLAGDRPRLALGAFDARRGGQRISLAGPANLEFADGGVSIRGLALNVGGGRLTVEGRAGERLDLMIAGRALPLSIASMFVADPGLTGALDAEAKLSGAASAPAGDWRLRVSGLSAPPLRSAGLPPIEISGNGRLEGGRTSVQANVNLGKAGSLAVSGAAPLDGSARLDIAVRGALDAAIANGSLAAGGRHVTGRLAIDARAEGAPDRPKLSGVFDLTGGSFSDALAGIRIDKFEAGARARGDDIVIDHARGVTRNGGTIGVSGSLKASPDEGFPASLRISAQNAELVSNPVVAAVADMALDLSGPLARRPRVTGKVSFASMDISVPERLSSAGQPLANTTHVDPPPAVKARLAREKAKQAKARQAPIFNADLDLAVSAPSRIFVRGRGIDAEFGGELKLRGTLEKPVADGGFDMRRGRLEIASQRLDFTRGVINFAGDIMPNLDFLAQTAAADVTAQITVTGAASNPQFTFGSIPSLPQDEVVSRLLFAKASGSLTPVQALQLAQLVAELSGQGGPDLLGKMRKSLGVDTLDVRVGADGKPVAGASRYIARNVNVGVRTGSRPEDSAVSLGVDVTKKLRAQGEIGADGKASVGVGVEWEY